MEVEELYRRLFDASTEGIIITDLETGKLLVANPAAAKMHGYVLQDLYRLQLHDLIEPQSMHVLEELKEAINFGGNFKGVVKHIRKDDSVVYVSWWSDAFNYQDRVYALSFLRDINERIQEERQLSRIMVERELELTTLLEISHALASGLELKPDLILDQLGILIKYTHASLFTIIDSTLTAVAVRGTGRLEGVEPFTVKLNGQGTLETLFNDRKPIRISDIWNDESSAQFLRGLLTGESVALLEGMRSWMWVPLAVKKRIIGGFGIASSTRNHFTSHDADLAMTIANQAAMTMANAELYEHAQTLAALQERQRLAQNLHDAVNQSLFSAGLITEVLPRLWDRDPDAGKRSLQDLRHLINGAMAEMRALLAELRPTTLTDTELGDLLLILGNAFTGRTNIPVNIMVIGERRLKAQTQVAIYRICQEALINIAKHAKATNVEIELNHSVRSLNLKIRDDGCGFDASELSGASHYGLFMMRERAENTGGVLGISSQIGLGTEIEVRWRIQKEG
jgi:PAS domain S-box-containing protein